jgi:polyribonucleotide nucleotidyltransferase
VNYQERYYAAGVPGGYFRRERAPTERETLISRLIDRPSARCSPTASQRNPGGGAGPVPRSGKRSRCGGDDRGLRRLTISGLPFRARSARRVGYIDGNTAEPADRRDGQFQLELVVAGTHDAVMMVESEARAREEVMLGAVMFGHKEMQHAINASSAWRKRRPRIRAGSGRCACRCAPELKVAASAELAEAFQLPSSSSAATP